MGGGIPEDLPEVIIGIAEISEGVGVASFSLGFVAEALERDRWAAIVSWPELRAEGAREGRGFESRRPLQMTR